MSDQSNRDRILSGYDAFNRRDIPAVLALLDEHVAWSEPQWTYGPEESSGTFYSPDEVLHNVFEPVGEYYDYFEPHPEHVYEDGDTVIVEGSFRVRPKGVSELLEVPFTTIWTFRDGKMVRSRNYIDVAQLYSRRELRRAA